MVFFHGVESIEAWSLSNNDGASPAVIDQPPHFLVRIFFKKNAHSREIKSATRASTAGTRRDKARADW
jgi:hypothetical protein